MHTVVALVSPTRQGRANARHIVRPDRFVEVHVATPLAVCQARDPKGLYRRAAQNEPIGLTGVQSAYEVPLAPDLTVDTQVVSITEAIALLVQSR